MDTALFEIREKPEQVFLSIIIKDALDITVLY